MIFIVCSLAVFILALFPTLLVFRNLQLFKLATSVQGADLPALSVLIPARDEAGGIEGTIRRVLANDYPQLEVVILDDHSSDGTPEIVSRLAELDSRVRLEKSRPLPAGWNGKQFACWQLAEKAKHELFLFIDADVQLEKDCLPRIVAEMEHSRADLLSGFPKQQMESLAEILLIPMMYHILLGYLPLDQMRSSTGPELGAGCGQMFMARRAAYFRAGGHESICNSRHDGLKLPRSFRKAGLRTDLFDASDIAHVRMYQGFREVVRGALKNATEGIANSKLIVLFTILLAGAYVLPPLLLLFAFGNGWHQAGDARRWSLILLSLATICSFMAPLLVTLRLRLSPLVVLLHPLSVTLFLLLQWIAFIRERLGLSQVAWRGRV